MMSLISPIDADFILQDILSHYYQNEINAIMNESILSSQNQCYENSEDIKQQICRNMDTFVYKNVHNLVKTILVLFLWNHLKKKIWLSYLNHVPIVYLKVIENNF